MTAISCFKRISSIILLALLGAIGTRAEMQIDNAIVIFEPDTLARRDITVSNTGDQPLYLNITPYRIIHPGTSRQQREKIVDPRSAGLLVTPSRLVVPPQGKKRVRFVNLDPAREDEGVFRVTIQPVTSELTSEGTGIKVMVGYEVLVLAQPKTPKADLVASRDGTRLLLRNRGNTDIYLYRGKQCPAATADEAECTPLRERRLYPGNEWALELANDGPVEFQLAIGSKHSARTFD